VDIHIGLTCDQALAGDEHLVHARHIVDEILTMHCPGCRGAILDWSGCLAVTCECKTAFCGLCLERALTGDAHQHVLVCPLNRPPKSYFADKSFIDGVHRMRRITAIREYLAGQADLAPGSSMRQQVLHSLAGSFKDLAITLDQL